jgi:cell division protein FtsB
LATLTGTNEKLATQLEAAQAQIAQLKDEVAELNALGKVSHPTRQRTMIITAGHMGIK